MKVWSKIISNYNEAYDDVYHSSSGGLGQSHLSFVEPHNYHYRGALIRVVEFGFGYGLNLASLLRHLDCFIERGHARTLEYYTCDEKTFEAIVHAEFLKEQGFCLYERQRFVSLFETGESIIGAWHIKLSLFCGDVLTFLHLVPRDIDVWLLDGHSPQKNPRMWSPEVFECIKLNSSSFATASTYASSGLVKEGLRSAGFFVKRKEGFGDKRHRVFAIKNSCQYSDLRI